ncbi:MAG TPA: hypothetical protein VGG93_04295 [Candidatus Udaeobacter sp.]
MMAAVVALFAIYLGIVPMLPAAPQEIASGSNTERLSRAPAITAKPERVTLVNGSGSTEIEWDTGTGSMGFVFVTEDGGKPVAFASGSRGTQIAPWIGNHRYVFELYGDDRRQTFFAKVAVSGADESVSSQRILSWQAVARWALIIGLAAISYCAVYLSSTGPVRTTFPTEPTTSPRQLHVSRNLLLGIVAFVCVDGAVFHSGLYVSILAPSSYAGRISRITRAEKERALSGLKEVLVLGDSRIAEGFSATLANELGSPAGLKFVSLAEPAASANTWYYMVREVDPTARRYAAIVIPYGIGYEPNSADALRISMTAPLLRYGDGFHFASGFQRSSGRFRAFTACILRGSAYQDDVVDLLSDPVARMRSIRQADKVHAGREYQGRDYDLVGTSYDAATGQVTFAPKLTEAQRLAFRRSLIQPSQTDTEYSLKLQRDWIPRIMDRYSHSPTAIVLTPLPRGPFLELGGLSRGYGSVLPTSVVEGSRFSLPGHTFDFLEKPEYYFDAFHLNAKGRQKFTETLVSELLGRLRSAESKQPDNFRSKLAMDRSHPTDEEN